MNRIRGALSKATFHPACVPLALLAACLLSYGLLIPWLGFYWDDWAFVWISQKLGAAGLQRYFSTNRPVWGLIYQATTALLGSAPWRWQLFGIFWRWTSAVSFWALLRLTWPRRSWLAAAAALLFVVYPGFDQQSIAITYGHFFLVLTAFLFSLAAMVAAARGRSRAWLLTALGMAFSLLNLLCMEYFFLLDLLRPVILWVALQEAEPRMRDRARRVWRAWAPYLLVFAAAVLWRTVFFQHQTHNYQPRLLAALAASPLQTLLRLALTVLQDLWKTGLAAWGQAFTLPVAELGARTAALSAAIAGIAGLAAFIFLARLRTVASEEGRGEKLRWIPAALGLMALLVAGWPFWLTQIPVGLIYPNSRFTLSFMLGATLLAAGLLSWAPVKNWQRTLVVAVLFGAAVGFQFQAANAFRRDWNLQKQLFWQMTWRAPGLQPGTAVLTNDLPTRFTSDNSLSAPLNWIYGPETPGEHMPYILYFPSVRVSAGLRGLKPDQPIEQSYLATVFLGNTSQTLSVVYEPPACLRVLDPQVDPANAMLPALMRQSAMVSRADRILTAETPSREPPASIYGSEPAHGWCYYYERADLARQMGDWDEVVKLGDEAFNLGDYPNDPAERFPFIEAYAHTGDWERAANLTREARAITPLMSDPLCRLWGRIGKETDESSEKKSVMAALAGELGCGTE